MTTPLTEGHELVAKVARRYTAAEVARRVDTGSTMISHIAAGRKTPGPELKQRLAARFDIPEEAWSRGHGQGAESVPDRASVPAPRSKARLDRTRPTVESLQATIDDIDATLATDISPTAKASLYRARIDALDRIAKLRGEHELSMQALARSRLWRDLLAKLAPVLEKHPEAAADIADVLEGLDQ